LDEGIYSVSFPKIASIPFPNKNVLETLFLQEFETFSNNQPYSISLMAQKIGNSF
jgi:hypothetical protein